MLSLADAIAWVEYVDVGLNSRGAFLTDPGAFDGGLGAWSAAHPAFGLGIHTTPRTAACRSRPWVTAERAGMLALARRAGLRVREVEHFAGQRGDTLRAHFMVLRELRGPGDRAPAPSNPNDRVLVLP